MDAHQLFNLAPHGPDTFVGIGPRYAWGGLYGGQIVAQALRAAAATVDEGLVVHSLRAYFIRRGDHAEPVRYEVDRIRNGRSFGTRRVVARQAIGAILNLEASFQRAEPSEDIELIAMPADVCAPEGLADASWSPLFRRRDARPPSAARGAGRTTAWMRAVDDLGDDELLHRCMLAFMSDDLPTEAVVDAHPLGRESREVLGTAMFSASLDHTIWFHRPLRADAWNLYDVTCHTFVGGRGLTIGHVFALDGTHLATFAQEALVRDQRQRSRASE
ncbi:MAG TPA: acyl-CoA thioesterase domain-containing protein [Ilumatobacteraceae bacterium]